MTALNFQPWKADLVMRGRSTQTMRREIKALYTGRPLTFYCGQRTNKCYKIGEGVCLGTEPVILKEWSFFTSTLGWKDNPKSIDLFARADGFKDYAKMWAFFLDRYFMSIEQDDGSFHGYRIWWRLNAAAQKNCIANYNRLKRDGFFEKKPGG